MLEPNAIVILPPKVAVLKVKTKPREGSRQKNGLRSIHVRCLRSRIRDHIGTSETTGPIRRALILYPDDQRMLASRRRAPLQRLWLVSDLSAAVSRFASWYTHVPFHQHKQPSNGLRHRDATTDSCCHPPSEAPLAAFRLRTVGGELSSIASIERQPRVCNSASSYRAGQDESPVALAAQL